jgi:hypothetical protein
VVVVEQVAQLQQPAVAVEVLVEAAADDRGAHGVEVQGAADLAALGLWGLGGVVDEGVAVAGAPAHVPALADAGLLALAGGDHEVVVVADRQADVDVAQHDRAEGLLERLVGAVQPQADAAQVVFEGERGQGVARGAVDGLAHHAIERARGVGGVVEQLG